MSDSTLVAPESLSISSSSVEELLIPFPFELQRVFHHLEIIDRNRRDANGRKYPSEQTVDWAREVLLRVVPSTYLRGAEIQSFESEIHVTWESEASGKSVIVFFPDPQELKIYWEWMKDEGVRQHDLTTGDVGDVSDRLRWFFSNE